MSEQKDRPDREKIAECLYGTSWDWSNELKHENWGDIPPRAKTYWYTKADQILALFNIEQIDAMLVEARRTAKREERERILTQLESSQDNIPEDTTGYRIFLVTEAEWQALSKEE